MKGLKELIITGMIVGTGLTGCANNDSTGSRGLANDGPARNVRCIGMNGEQHSFTANALNTVTHVSYKNGKKSLGFTDNVTGERTVLGNTGVEGLYVGKDGSAYFCNVLLPRPRVSRLDLPLVDG